MTQLTLYLDKHTQTLVEKAAKAQGVSRSRWVADLIRCNTAETWPEEFLNLAGRFPDFPLREDLPLAATPDLPREGF